LHSQSNFTFRQSVPFLPVRDDFHPKRNQARQKLATLPATRFEDLSSDVYYELERRYPEFKEELVYRLLACNLAESLISSQANVQSPPGSGYDDYPSPDFPNPPYPHAPVPIHPIPRSQYTIPEDRGVDSGYGGSIVSGRKSDERRRPTEDDYPIPRKSNDAYAGPDPASLSRRKKSQDITRRLDDIAPGRPSLSNSDSTATTNAQTATATSGMIIPNKSIMAEEEIEIPYGREAGEGMHMDRDRIADMDGTLDGEADTNLYASPLAGSASPLGGLSGLSARLRADEDDEGQMSGGNRSGEDYFDKMSFGRAASAASDRSIGARVGGGRSSVTNEDHLRREYEYKLATMQSKITGLERDLSDADERVKKSKMSEERVRQMEEELSGLRRVSSGICPCPMLLNTFIRSARRSSRAQSATSNANSTICGRRATGRKNGKHGVPDRTRMSSKHFAGAVSILRSRPKGWLRFVNLKLASSSPYTMFAGGPSHRRSITGRHAGSLHRAFGPLEP
jgi:protein SPA2